MKEGVFVLHGRKKDLAIGDKILIEKMVLRSNCLYQIGLLEGEQLILKSAIYSLSGKQIETNIFAPALLSPIIFVKAAFSRRDSALFQEKLSYQILEALKTKLSVLKAAINERFEESKCIQS